MGYSLADDNDMVDDTDTVDDIDMIDNDNLFDDLVLPLVKDRKGV